MPIQIDRKRAENLAPQFDEALELVRNEFEGLDPHRQYRNAFARLLKPDPLGRVLMMGTDQRDMFAPEIRRAIETSVPSDGHIFDFGAGDGQTFALVADSVPQGTRVSIEEPNPEYLANYCAFLKTRAHLRPGMALAAEFDEIDAAAERSGEKLPSDGSIDLGLALHMIYFVNDLPASVTRMVRFLKCGGVLFVVVTDETVGYTGLALKSFIEHGGDTGDNVRHLSVIAERRRLLGLPAEGGGAIAEVLGAAGTPVEINVRRQPTPVMTPVTVVFPAVLAAAQNFTHERRTLMLVLTNEDVEQVLILDVCVQAVEYCMSLLVAAWERCRPQLH